MDVGDIEATECFRLWDDAETASSCNPFQDGDERCPKGRINGGFASA